MLDPDCIFCKIVAGDSTATIVDTFSDAIVIEPINPVVPGHVLVIPHEHVTDFADRSDIAAATMYRAAYFAQAHGGVYDDCNLITSRGPAATQTVFHLHLHLVPRQPGDGLELPWSSRDVARRAVAAAETGWAEHTS
jgi:histidine triad (HIT) family protein